MATSTFKLVNGDVPASSATGRPLLITDSDKFRQDVSVNLGTNPRADGTGAGLGDVIGRIEDIFSLRAEMSQRITGALEAYRVLQSSVQREDRSLQERFGRLAQFIVLPARNSDGDVSNTDYAYRVDVLSQQPGRQATSITGVLVA